MTVRITPEMCVAGRELAEPRLSPDGRQLAYSVSWGGRSAIVVTDLGPAGHSSAERIVTSDPQPRAGRGLSGGCFDWLPDGSGVVYAGRDGGVWLQRVPGGAPTLVVAGSADRAALAPAVSPDGRRIAYVVDMAEVWCVLISPDASLAGPLETSRPERLSAGADFCADPAWTPDGTAVVWHEWDVPNMAWDESRIVRARVGGDRVDVLVSGRSLQVQQPRYSRDGALFHLADRTGWLNVQREDRPVLDEPHEHGDPTWGVGQRSFAVSPDGRRVAVCRNEAGFGRLVVVDLATGAVDELARAVHGHVSWAGTTIAAIRTGARTPTQVVTYDVGALPAARTTIAVGPVLGFDAADLPEPELVEWRSEDGTVLHGRRYASGGGPSRGVLCWLHGGPTDQWQVTFMPRLAYWVQQGWTIVVPDHRGSTGHGREYQQAMREGWGVVDTHDAASAIVNAHANGWSDPGTTVVVGGSAGGFTALNVLVHHPGLVAGGVVLYPVTDLAALDETTHRFEAHYNHSLVGPTEVAAERYAARSPLWHAERITAPLLILHGDEDPVVALSQSEALRDRIVDAAGDVELVVYAGEGHGFRQPANQLDEYRRMATFLDRVVP